MKPDLLFIEITSGLNKAFQSDEAGSPLTGAIAMVTYAEFCQSLQ